MPRQYVLADDDGYGQYSADAADYWYLTDADTMPGALVRMDHPHRTVTGHTVYAPRLLKSHPVARDLRRLERASRASRGAVA